MPASSLIISFFAGNLATLSPCVFPVLPLVAGSALQESKWGPVALSTGMMLSFTAVGVTLAAMGNILGLETETFKIISGALLVLAGLSFLTSKSKFVFERVFQKVSLWGNQRVGQIQSKGIYGQFLIGLIIGTVWSPCTGPALGAAVGLAAKAQTRVLGMFSMFIFSLGTILPFLGVSYGLRIFAKKDKVQKLNSSFIRPLFGILLLIFGSAVITGFDKKFESWALELMPQYLLEFITQL